LFLLVIGEKEKICYFCICRIKRKIDVRQKRRSKGKIDVRQKEEVKVKLT